MIDERVESVNELGKIWRTERSEIDGLSHPEGASGGEHQPLICIAAGNLRGRRSACYP